MATNAIQGDLVALSISTNVTTPAYKEVVCSENSGLDGSADVNTKRTKCGVIKGVGPMAWTFTGSGAFNSIPGGSAMSAQELVTAAQDQTPILVKLAHATDATIYYRQGQGIISSYSETANSGDVVSYDFTIDIEGDLDVLST